MSSMNQHRTSEEIKRSIRVRSLRGFVTTTKKTGTSKHLTNNNMNNNSNKKADGYYNYDNNNNDDEQQRSFSEFVTVEETSQSTLGVEGRMVIVRPFAPHDAKELYLSFQEWDKYMPCEIEIDHTSNSTRLVPTIDLVLSFSQTLSDHPETYRIVQEMKEMFDAKQGWSRCFSSLTIHEAHIHESEDVYDKDPRKKLKSPEWVVGPNLQFQRLYNAMIDAGRYETMIIMEKDTIPRAASWTNRMLDEIDSRRPFAVLGR